MTSLQRADRALERLDRRASVADVLVPATLVWRFRLASLGANLTLWTVLTLGMGWVVAAAARRAASPAGPGRQSVRLPA